MGVDIPEVYELMRTVAEQLGVPKEAIYDLGDLGGSTFSEAQAILRFLQHQGVRTILLVTSKLHTYRAGVIFRHLAGDQLRIIVRPSRYDRFDANSWWQDRTMLRRVIIEYEKLLVFLLVDRWRLHAVGEEPIPVTS